MPVISTLGNASARGFGFESTQGPVGTPPVNTAIPVITGDAYVGYTLTSSTGTWTGDPTPTYTYQWQQGTSDISGATSSTYVIQAGDEGSTLRCVVTATNSAGSASANSANTAVVTTVSAPVNTAVPVVTGMAEVGFTLTSSTGTWTGVPTPTYTYQWQRGTTNISGATSSTYVAQVSDVGSTLRCRVTATNIAGSATANSANTNSVYNPPLAYGAPYQGGYFAGQISTSGDGVPSHNLVVAPAASGSASYAQKTSRTATAGTSSTIDGPGNTAVMIAAGAAAHPAANFCNDLTIGGYSDWYLPAVYELTAIYNRLKPSTANGTGNTTYMAPPFTTSATQTSDTDFKVGGSQAFTSSGSGTNAANQHWTSTTTTSASGRSVSFSNGSLLSYFKTQGRLTRAVRRVAV